MARAAPFCLQDRAVWLLRIFLAKLRQNEEKMNIFSDFWRNKKQFLFRATFIVALGTLCCSSAWADPADKFAQDGHTRQYLAQNSRVKVDDYNDSAAAKKQVQRLIKEVQRARSLHFKEAVNCHFCTQSEAGRYLVEANKKASKPYVQGRRDLFFHHLGLLENGQTFQNYSDLLYSEQVRGLYDTINKILLVVTDILQEPKLDGMLGKILSQFNIDLSDLLLVHELCHALQDQNFDLGQKLLQVDGSLDKELALTAVAEGDATQTMFDYLASSMGLSGETVTKYVVGSPKLIEKGINQFPQLEQAPLIVRAITLMPYLSGLEFCQTIQEQQGLRGINNAFAEPPVSTEHVLHPFKHLKKVDLPKNIDLSALPKSFGNYVSLGDDTAGEYVIRTWAEKFLSTQSMAVARGWGGDTWRVYSQAYESYGLDDKSQLIADTIKTSDGQQNNDDKKSIDNKTKTTETVAAAKSKNRDSFTIWATVWDSEGDAQEFVRAVKQSGLKAEIMAKDRSVIVLLNVPNSQIKAVRKALAKPSVLVRG